jgi:hypothetical protein
VGGSLGVLLKASRVRFLSLIAIFFAAIITDGGGQNEGGAERGGSLPLTFFIVVEIVTKARDTNCVVVLVGT